MTYARRPLLMGLGASLLAGAVARPAAAVEAPHVVEGPLDHDQPHGDRFPVRYGLLAPLDPKKPTVFAVADGQQFYVTAQAFAPSVGPIFGDRFNVVGVFGRADAPEVQRRVGSGAETDWAEAYRLLRADQWIGDLDLVRRSLLGGDGAILLYGRSGGGLLVHQYLARHGRHVRGAFTQAAVNNFVEAEFGLASDRFWEELAVADRERLIQLLNQGAIPRSRLAAVFQRQNFFVDRAHLAQARSDLISLLADGRTEQLAKLEADYQVDALVKLDATARGPAAHVRLFEFFAPISGGFELDPRVLRPDLEVSAAYARPLLELLRAGRIAAPTLDLAAMQDVRGDVFLLAGRWDHTCDYRSQIALAACYRSHRLVILDDDHTFHRLGGQANAVTRGALSGFGSPEFQTAMQALTPLRWREDATQP